MSKNTYSVYCHINKINNKRYIGITKDKPVDRWGKDGNGYKTQVFGRAIEKYGWDNFEHKILFENLSKKEAENKEIELIAFYQSNKPDYGYNVSGGGNLSDYAQIPVNQFDFDGNLIGEYVSSVEASKITGVNTNGIRSSCKGEYIASGGFIWRYKGDAFDKYPTERPYNVGEKTYSHREVIPVDQYDFDKNFIATYPSISNASISLGGVCHILEVINGERQYAGGYYWTRHGQPLIVPEDVTIGVVAYYTNGEIAKEYDDINIASKEMNTNNTRIKYACVGKRLTVGGYIWRYKEDDFDTYKTTRKTGWKVDGSIKYKPIYQFDLDRNFIKKWDTIIEASRFYSNGNSDKGYVWLSMACLGECKQMYGYLWSFTEEAPTYSSVRANHYVYSKQK